MTNDIFESAHWKAAEALLEEEKYRDSYWLLTDVELPGMKEFYRRCKRFNRRARKRNLPTLKDVRILLTVPDD